MFTPEVDCRYFRGLINGVIDKAYFKVLVQSVRVSSYPVQPLLLQSATSENIFEVLTV